MVIIRDGPIARRFFVSVIVNDITFFHHKQTVYCCMYELILLNNNDISVCFTFMYILIYWNFDVGASYKFILMSINLGTVIKITLEGY